MRIALFCIMAERTKHNTCAALISLLSATTYDEDVSETTRRRKDLLRSIPQ